MATADNASGEGCGEEVDEVGAMHAEGGVPTGRVGHLHRGDRRAVVVEVVRVRADARTPLLDRWTEADAFEVAHAVRCDEDASANLAER